MKRRSEAGQALILAALALVVLSASAGLAVDMGVMRYEKRLQQSAADAAAIAGASNLKFGGVTSGAQAAAGKNGFTDNSGGQVSACNASGAKIGTVCVQINNPPASGPHTNDANYVEALVAVVHPTYFMNLVRIFSETVTARAVATTLGGGPNTGCAYSLGPPSSSIEGVNVNGSATLNAPTCGIVDNGNFNTKGNNLVVNTSTFGTSGSWQASGPGGTVTCSETPSSCPTPNMPAATDPLGYLTPPCSPCTGGSAITINGNGNFTGSGVTYSSGVYTISPGTYTSIKISGTGSGNSVVFSSGIFIINGSSGGITIPGNATISSGTGGVMFYFTNGSTIQSTGTPSVKLTAMSSGTYAGILMYQDPNDTNTTGPSLGGNNGSYFDGALYFPKDQLTFYGNNSSVSVAMLVVDSLALSGNPTVNLLGTPGLPAGVNVIKVATLVE
jgi:Flp pilus assembly protein TadG